MEKQNWTWNFWKRAMATTHCPSFFELELEKPLENTPLCEEFQRKSLLNEIRFKRKNLTLNHAKLEEARAALKESVTALDYSCITLWLQRK